MVGSWSVRIAPGGKITVEGIGFEGSACELPAALLEAIGAVENRERKSAYYAQVTGEDRVQSR